MVYNNAEFESSEAIEAPEQAYVNRSWGEVFDAATEAWTSVGISTSENNSFQESLGVELDMAIEKYPEHKEQFERLRGATVDLIDRYDDRYERGDLDAIKFDSLPFMESSIGNAYLKFRELGLKDFNNIREEAKTKSLKKYTEASKVLESDGSLTAKLAGSMYGILHDPAILASLPFGTWKTGGTLAWNAARAFGEESLIETAVQGIVAPKVHAYKNEIGLRTSVMESVYNAATAIGTAGLFRAAGSATFDLTEKGLRLLRQKDPELAAEYETMSKTNVSQSMDDHIKNMDAVEFGSGHIKNLNENGEKLAKQELIVEVQPEEIKRVEETKAREVPDDQLYLHAGQDEKGNDVYKTYADSEAELNAEEELLNKYFSQKDVDTGSEQYGKTIEQQEASMPKTKGFQPKTMIVDGTPINKTDFDNIKKYQNIRKWNRENPDKKKDIPDAVMDSYKRHEGIADGILDMDFVDGAKFKSSEVMFNKFADNLAAGTVAGIEEDENGNITFNPEMFVAGLGGYTAVKAAYKAGVFDSLPDEVNRQVKKYFGVDLEPGILDKDAIPNGKPTGVGEMINDIPAYNKRESVKDVVGELDSGSKKYTEKELDKMAETDGERLDKLAFGYNDGDIANIKIDDINLIYDDIENPEYKFEKGGMNWVKSVKFDEPIKISIDESGKLNLEDGHHRYFAAKKLGKKDITAEIELKGNPIRKILKDQEK